MTTPQTQPPGIPIDSRAQDLIRGHVADFAQSLVLEAKLLATRANYSRVMPEHVPQALDRVYRERRPGLGIGIATLIAGGFFGAGGQGFIDALSEGNTTLVVAYVSVGFLGLILGFVALTR